MRSKNTDLLFITLGFTLIALGGFARFLNNELFWYPFGLMTVPFISSWIAFIQSKIRKPTVVTQVNQ